MEIMRGHSDLWFFSSDHKNLSSLSPRSSDFLDWYIMHRRMGLADGLYDNLKTFCLQLWLVPALRHTKPRKMSQQRESQATDRIFSMVVVYERMPTFDVYAVKNMQIKVKMFNFTFFFFFWQPEKIISKSQLWTFFSKLRYFKIQNSKQLSLHNLAWQSCDFLCDTFLILSALTERHIRCSTTLWGTWPKEY